jgi:hypothetical protein
VKPSRGSATGWFFVSLELAGLKAQSFFRFVSENVWFEPEVPFHLTALAAEELLTKYDRPW